MKKEQSYTNEHLLAVSLLKDIIPMISYSGEEDAKASYLQAFLNRQEASAHYSVLRFRNNLIAAPLRFEASKPTLMMCAHMDTVRPASDYSFEPHAVFERDGAIYGLGTNDDGGSLVAQVATFLHFYGQPERLAKLSVNLLLVLSAEEENSGSEGMSAVLSYMKENTAFYPDFAIVGEPTSLKAAVGERGLLVLDGVATGVSGHAAREEGVNALYIALEDVMKIRNFTFAKVSPLMGRTKATVTVLHSGRQHNVIPDRAEFTVDIRPNELYDSQEILDLLQHEVKSRLTARNLRHRSSFTPEDHPLMRTVSALGIGTYVSPTTSDWMLLDFPAVKLGPGDSSRSHKKDEYITTGEIADGIGLYIHFIENI